MGPRMHAGRRPFTSLGDKEMNEKELEAERVLLEEMLAIDRELEDEAAAGSVPEQEHASVQDVPPECGMDVVPVTRWTREACSAMWRIKRSRNVLYHVSRKVIRIGWDRALPGQHPWEKFLASLNKTESEKAYSDASIKEDLELFPQDIPEQLVSIPAPVYLPHWNHLPGEDLQEPGIRELVMGLRIAAVLHGEAATPSSWWSDDLRGDGLALSIDLRGEKARRVLEGEAGSTSKWLSRYLKRPLETVLGDVAMAAAWTDIGSSRLPGIRLFLFLRSSCDGHAHDMEVLDRSDRYFRSLVKHEIALPPDGMPIFINDLDKKAKYFKISREELEERMDLWPGDEQRIGWIEEQEFSRETGFVTASEIEARAKRSHERWRRITAEHRLPVWFGAAVQSCIERQLGHVQDSKRFRTWLPIQVYRGSPACLAAVAMRTDRVLGTYVDVRHKGAAASLFSQLRELERGR